MPHYIFRKKPLLFHGKIFRYIAVTDKNEYDMVKEMDAANYYKMQIADYILEMKTAMEPILDFTWITGAESFRAYIH